MGLFCKQSFAVHLFLWMICSKNSVFVKCFCFWTFHILIKILANFDKICANNGKHEFYVIKRLGDEIFDFGFLHQTASPGTILGSQGRFICCAFSRNYLKKSKTLWCCLHRRVVTPQCRQHQGVAYHHCIPNLLVHRRVVTPQCRLHRGVAYHHRITFWYTAEWIFKPRKAFHSS